MTCLRINLTPDIGMFVCRISDEQFDMVPSQAEIEREFREYEIACDLHQERQLAQQYLAGIDECPDWPWYADSPCEIEEPQVFEP